MLTRHEVWRELTPELDHTPRSQTLFDLFATYSQSDKDILPNPWECHSVAIQALVSRLYFMFLSEPTSVMAKGVRLNGAFGFSEFLHNKMYSFCA